MVRVIHTREQLLALVEAGTGYLYNDFGGSDPKNCPVHSMQCPWVRSMLNVRPGPLGVKKIWSASLSELLDHLRERGKAYQFCGSEPHLATVVGAKRSARPDDMPTRAMRALLAGETASPPSALGPAGFRIETAHRTRGPVECWSIDRLPFEPKRELLVMRDLLRDEVRVLIAGEDEVLEGVYTSPVLDEVDTENVLFYNVGLGCFVAGTGRGLRFERRFAACPAPPRGTADGALHHVAYRIAPESAPFRHWKLGAPLAFWSSVPCPALHEYASASEIWLAMKRHGWTTSGAAGWPGRPFAIRLRLAPGEGGAAHVAAMVKPLLDAVVAAMHVHDGRDLGQLAARLGAATGSARGEIEHHLMDGGRAVLGARRLLWKWGESVQWNPADHLCVAAEILLEPRERATGEWRHSGQLYPVTEA